MYFVVNYNYINNQLSDWSSLGVFRTLLQSKKFVKNSLPDLNYNTVAIIKAGYGINLYYRPLAVYEWHEDNLQWVPVGKEDRRNKVLVTY